MMTGLQDGERATFSACQKYPVVKVFTKKQFAVSGPDPTLSFKKGAARVKAGSIP